MTTIVKYKRIITEKLDKYRPIKSIHPVDEQN